MNYRHLLYISNGRRSTHSLYIRRVVSVSTCWHQPSSARYRVVEIETNNRLSWQPVLKTQDAKHNNNSNNNRTLVWHWKGVCVCVCVCASVLCVCASVDISSPFVGSGLELVQTHTPTTLCAAYTWDVSGGTISKGVCQLLAPYKKCISRVRGRNYD